MTQEMLLEMNTKDIRELQLEQYEVLKEIKRVCAENDITYYLMYGTLLGAIRHKASIPWDYDIDIAMTRAEHNLFLEVASQLPERMKLEHICYSDIDHAGLTRVITNTKKFGWIHVDIFILDYAKEYSGVARKFVGAYCKFMHIAKLSELERQIILEHFKDDTLKKLVVKVCGIVNHLFGSEKIEKWNYRILVSEHPTDNLLVLESPNKPLPTSCFGKGIEVPFEDSIFTIPKNYKWLLHDTYGDYMQIPPEGIEYMELLKKENQGA